MTLLVTELDRFFRLEAPLEPEDLVLVAFSGGTDSTALLLGLAALARRGRLRLHAAHLDHGLDPGSSRRARQASALAARLGVPCFVASRPVDGREDNGLEAAARTARYRFLEELRGRLGARFVATAHQRDDQVETVLLRLTAGSGVAGLSGIPARRGALVRPLLALARTSLAAALDASGLEPVADPTNEDLSRPRNLLRRRLLPRLLAEEPQLDQLLLRLAAAAAGARARVDDALERRLAPRPLDAGAALARRPLASLPAPLLPHALALLHRHAGLPYPPRREARAELERQLRRGGRVGCDCGGGWRWEGRGELLAVQPRATAPGRFTYTLSVPGELEIPEIARLLRLRREPVAPWMFQRSTARAGLALPVEPGGRVVVRNRRPGDRLRPLGAMGGRRLKDVLIDHRVPRDRRDLLPLLCVEGRIAWVPGVTIDEAFRVPASGLAWVAEIVPT